MDSVTAMAVSPDGANLAVHASLFNNGDWLPRAYIFVIRTKDGGHVTEILESTHGSAGQAEHRVYDSGIVYAPTGKVFLAFD